MNRDESFNRSSTSIQHQTDLNIICGRDLEKGGTWLAADLKGRFVAVTNIRCSQALSTSPESRGKIPLELLKRETFDPEEWKQIVEELGCKNFNLLFGELNGADPLIYTYGSDTSELKCVKEKMISMSNGNINQVWDKQLKGEKLFRDSLLDGVINEDAIFKIMRDDEGFSEDINQFQKWPIFIKSRNGRGTVSTSIIMVDYENKVDFVERVWNEDGELKRETRINFKISN